MPSFILSAAEAAPAAGGTPSPISPLPAAGGISHGAAV